MQLQGFPAITCESQRSICGPNAMVQAGKHSHSCLRLQVQMGLAVRDMLGLQLLLVCPRRIATLVSWSHKLAATVKLVFLF
jgi:hypothetical protein